MAEKMDKLRGLNPDQSGPLEKIQNGDPKSGANRDQRSGAAEAGGPKGSLDNADMGGKQGSVPPHEGLEDVKNVIHPKPAGVKGEPDHAGALDRAGMDPETGKSKGDDPAEKANVEVDPETGSSKKTEKSKGD